jgi:curli biogenesis system outer membrane secretion channel CsgG
MSMVNTEIRRPMALMLFIALTAVSVRAQGITQPRQGQGGSVVKGAAGTEGGVGDKGLEHCDKPMGAMAVVEPQSQVLTALARYRLSSPVSLIRLMLQQSNCFIVVERGVGMQNLMQERQLAASGNAREGSNIGGGQMVAADFVMTPSVVFSENNAGGVGAGVASVFGGRAAAIAGGLKFKEAQTSMLVADSRSGVQVAAAEGSTRKADLRLGGALFGGGAGAAGGGYGNTNEGKIIAAAFMDNYNNVVKVVRNDPSLLRNVGTLKQEAAAGGATRAGAVFNEGDVLVPKIANVKLLAEPSDSAKVVGTLGRTDELVVVGSEKNGYINVQGGAAAGWIKIVLVQKR